MDHCIVLDENPAIRYEQGAEEYALLVAGYYQGVSAKEGWQQLVNEIET